MGATFTDPTGETVGTVTERNQSNFWGVRLGVSLIRAESTNDTYAGGINDGTESLKYQAGALGNYVGMWVCTSGGASGGHCGIKVTRTGVAVDGLSDLVVAEQPDKMVAAGGGDSGGPVYVPVDNSALIRALGLIQGGGLQSTHFASCPPTGFASRCSWQVWYTDINAILYWMGLQLAGGS